MEPIFFEVVLESKDLLTDGFESRDEIEESLEKALAQSGLGEVTGGGSGMGKAIIDVEMSLEVSLDDALVFLRETLQRLRVPRSTLIKRHVPQEQVFSIY